MNITVCPHCEYVWTVKEQEKRFAELQIMEYGEIIKSVKEAKTVSEMEEIRIARGYKLGWLIRQFSTYDQFKEYAKMKGYKNGWIKINYHNYLHNQK